MTIKEKYAKFTTEQLAKAVAELKKKLEDDRKAVEHFRVAGDAEFYQMAEHIYQEDCDLYLDVKCAYEGRMRG